MEEVWAEAAGHGTGLESGLEHGSTERKDTLYIVSRLLFLKLNNFPKSSQMPLYGYSIQSFKVTFLPSSLFACQLKGALHKCNFMNTWKEK